MSRKLTFSPSRWCLEQGLGLGVGGTSWNIVRPGMGDPAPSKRVGGDAILDDPLILELLHERLVGVFATLDSDGAIHAVPMWFASHERSILLATGSRSTKVANLEVDSRSTLVIHDSRPGYEVCGVSMVGTRRSCVALTHSGSFVTFTGAISTKRETCQAPSGGSWSRTTLPFASARSRRSPGISARPKRTSRCELRLLHFLFSQPTRDHEGRAEAGPDASRARDV